MMDEDDLPPPGKTPSHQRTLVFTLFPVEHASPIDLHQCDVCGRKFNPDILVRFKLAAG